MKDIPDAPWIGIDKEEYEEHCNLYFHLEKWGDYEAEESDRCWKEVGDSDE